MTFRGCPEPVAGWSGEAETARRSVMSNFAAMIGPRSVKLSRADKPTSGIIDAISNAGYVFRENSVKLRSAFPFGLFELHESGKVLLPPIRTTIPAFEGSLRIFGARIGVITTQQRVGEVTRQKEKWR